METLRSASEDSLFPGRSSCNLPILLAVITGRPSLTPKARPSRSLCCIFSPSYFELDIDQDAMRKPLLIKQQNEKIE